MSNMTTPDIKGVPMQALTHKITSVMNTENGLQLVMVKAMDRYRDQMNTVTGKMAEESKTVESCQKWLSVIKDTLTVVTILSAICVAPMMLPLGATSSPILMGVLQGGQIGFGAITGVGQIAQGGIEGVNGMALSASAKFKTCSDSLNNQLESLDKAFDGTSSASRQLAEASSEMIEGNYRAQIITSNLI